MTPRFSPELIQSLRVTLQKLEEDIRSQVDPPVVAELKRLLLLRIAELEAIESADANEASEVGAETQPLDDTVSGTRVRPT